MRRPGTSWRQSPAAAPSTFRGGTFSAAADAAWAFGVNAARVCRYAIRSARSCESGTVTAISVPGTALPGLARYWSSIGGNQMRLDSFMPFEYAKPGTAPGTRPTTPLRFGPIAPPVLSGPAAWHSAQRSSNSVCPRAASAVACASAADAKIAMSGAASRASLIVRIDITSS
jgi:hypothetical protein